MNERPTNAWHLDKRVPIALIVSLAVQTAGLVWWAATLEGRINDATRRIELSERRNEEDRLMIHNGINRLVRIETILERIERSITFPGR